MPYSDPERRRASAAEYRNKHRDVLNFMARLRYEKNVERHREEARAKHARNPEKHRKAVADWKRSNPEKVKDQSRRQYERSRDKKIAKRCIKKKTGLPIRLIPHEMVDIEIARLRVVRFLKGVARHRVLAMADHAALDTSSSPS